MLERFEGRDSAESPRTPRVLLLRDMPEQRKFSMERFADEFERALRATGRFEVHSTAIHHSAAARFGLKGLDSYVARFLRYPLKLYRQRADLYHVVDHGYAHVAALIPKKRTVVTCHDLMLLLGEESIPELRGRRASVARFRWTISYLRQVAHVVCVSQSTADDVVRLGGVPEERITVVPNGLHPRFVPLSDGLRAKLKAQLPGVGEYAVLHIAARLPYKNIAETLRVLAALRDASIDVTLVRVGPPLAGEDGQLAERLGLGSAIVECGNVSDERLVELYNACNALLFPSIYEGFGWPALEAMACGTPVVSSNRGGLAELVGDAGLTADPYDTAGLADVLRLVLGSQDIRYELRSRGIKRAAEFTWDRAVDGYARVYEEVLSRAESGHRGPGRRICSSPENTNVGSNARDIRAGLRADGLNS